jgi:hypothetical protein
MCIGGILPRLSVLFFLAGGRALPGSFCGIDDLVASRRIGDRRAVERLGRLSFRGVRGRPGFLADLVVHNHFIGTDEIARLFERAAIQEFWILSPGQGGDSGE